MSNFGKSGNKILDKFILEKRLKWIPYYKFKNVEYLNKGGFGTIHKAIWSYENRDREVILKCHNNLNENLNEFLNEWKYHESCLGSYNIIYFYGFTKNPDTLKYMAVMDYANKGDLRGNLIKIVESGWDQKLCMLYEIISGLQDIHNQNLIHHDFHDGNILNHDESKIFISDLGLCQPVKSLLEEHNIYGVVPFMAPEVLRGKPYIPASDIYSFSMIMWEFTSGIPPFNNRAHDIQLSLSICGDEDPLKRPSSKEASKIINEWISLPYSNKIEDISEELKCNIMEFINAPIGHNNLVTESHPQAYCTSRLLNFTSKQLNEILESKNSQTSVQVSEMLVSEDLNECIIRY
ncbi:kinase-like domain-containing protein [Rhizophagus irregularis DAOM 181602=DAOM 197198]|nr:kinase-like domain-containing protein [Rhizophagus irregularis DAOM 181602=DAOM 197198]